MMRMRLPVIGVFAAILMMSAAKLGAQTKLYTLDDYINAAVTGNPLINSANSSASSARFGENATRASFYPLISIGSHLIAAPGYDEAITNGGEFGAQLSGAYTIYDGGTRSYEIKKSQLGTQQSVVNISKVIADVTYGVSTAFAEAVKQKRELEVVREGYALLSDYLQLTKQLHASGQGSETDVLKTTVELNNASIDIESRKVAYKNALLSLALASGLAPSRVVDVDSSGNEVRYDSTLNAEQNVDLQFQQLALQQAEVETQIAGAKRNPSVSLGADMGALSSLPNLKQGLSGVFGASIGLSVSVPLFSFGAFQDNYLAAEANAKSISLQVEFAKAELVNDFLITRNNVDRADSEIESLRKNLVVANQNLLLSRARYAGGTGTSLEVLDSIRMVEQIRLAIEEATAERDTDIFRMNRLNYAGVK